METIKINILGLRSVIDIAIKAKTKNFYLHHLLLYMVITEKKN